MSRNSFGGTIADFLAATNPGGVLRVTSGTVTCWSDKIDGTQYTDLLLNGAAVASVPVGANGQIPEFQGPDDVVSMWIQGNDLPTRVRIESGLGIAELIEDAASPTDALVAGWINGGTSAVAKALAAAFMGAVVIAGTGIDPTGATASTSAVQAKIDAAPDGSTIYFPKGVFKCGNLTVTGKSGVTITGPGKINWTGTAAGSDSIGFQLVGTLTDLTIEGLRLNGDGVVANRHAGVWCYSGQEITNLRVLRNRITNVGLGVSIGCIGSGHIDGALIAFNDLDNIVGTAAGSGYGLHHGSDSDRAKGVKFIGNTIRRAQRHSIYQAKGDGALIMGNHVIDHRIDVAAVARIHAIVCGRGSNHIIVNNVLHSFYDGGMSIFSDTGAPCHSVLVKGNIFRGQGNAVPALEIGEDTPATLGFPTGITIEGNDFYSDGVAYQFLRIYAGKRIKWLNNTMVCLNAPSSVTLVDYYGSQESGGALYSDQITAAFNTLFLSGGTDGRGIRISDLLAGGTALLRFLHNEINTVGSGVDIYPGATVTNPNIQCFGQPHSLGAVTLKTTITGPVSVS